MRRVDSHVDMPALDWNLAAVTPGSMGDGRARESGMTHLHEALQVLGLHGEVELGGTWLTLPGERCRVYVMGTAWGAHYYTWGDDPQDRTVQVYDDPTTAIQRGLQRAARTTTTEAR